MKRNMDLVRTILMRIEGQQSGWSTQPFGIQGASPEEVSYHAHIMMQEGLIEPSEVAHSASSGSEVMPRSLTWKGHEFLDLARDQGRWNQAKAIIAKVGSAPISVWTKVLTDLMWKNVDAVVAKNG